MDEVTRQVIESTADEIYAAVATATSVIIERIEREHGKEVAARLEGYVLDAAFGAARRLGEIFLADDKSRPIHLQGVAKMAADRVDEELARISLAIAGELPGLKEILGIFDDAS